VTTKIGKEAEHVRDQQERWRKREEGELLELHDRGETAP